MRLLGLLIVVLMLVLPAPARAQVTTLIDIAPAPARSVRMKDLVGSWARQGEKEVRFTFRADSTATVSVETTGGPGTATGHWRLVGDTLAISDFIANVKGQKISSRFDRRLVRFKDKKLTMTRVDNLEQGEKTRIYERVASVKVDPSKP